LSFIESPFFFEYGRTVKNKCGVNKMSKKTIPYESIPVDEIPERLPIPQDWLDILNSGEALVVPEEFRSACYQRFRKAGLKVKTTKVEGSIYIRLA